MMPAKTNQNQFIVFADVIRSRDLTHAALSRGLEGLLAKLRKSETALFQTPPMRSLGDEIQMMPKSLHAAVRIITLMEEYFLKRKTVISFRYVLTFGEVKGLRTKAKMTALSGKGLIRARALINENKDQDNYNTNPIKRGAAWVDLPSESAANVIETVLYSLARIKHMWKREHYNMVAAMIDGKSDNEIARQFHYTPSAVWKRRERMDIHNYLRLRALLEDLTNLDVVQKLATEIKR